MYLNRSKNFDDRPLHLSGYYRSASVIDRKRLIIFNYDARQVINAVYKIFQRGWGIETGRIVKEHFSNLYDVRETVSNPIN